MEIESALDLYDAMMREAPAQDVIIQAAAVADYRFAETHPRKWKKQGEGRLTVSLVENPDIAQAVGEQKKPGQTLVGFAAETDHLAEHAAEKMRKKNLDMIVANDVTRKGAGFNVDTNIATLFTRYEALERPLQSKRQLAEDILDEIMRIR